ncbi:hypothetical protein [Desulfatirhabdium butyrativorans]|uniref:hypothetical protein n=1 Tax=Desulfatirhabdium butyrativorans TaxID=340467 RepID=UPI0012EC92B9|nr:hypothetical protein [Desulfatirhabdium butyrativorans]
MAEEIRAGGRDAFGLDVFEQASWLEIKPDPVILLPYLRNSLDRGEASVIQTALQDGTDQRVSHSSGGKMLSHKLQTKISKSGYLELINLPFTAGTQIEVTISTKKKKKKDFKRLIGNDHVWSEEDIRAVEAGREIMNQWKIS